MHAARRFRELLAAPGPIVAPGVYDCVSAKVVERAGFDAAFVSGAAVTASVLGYPDVGLQTMPEILGQVRNMARTVDIPLIVDIDQSVPARVTVQLRQVAALLADEPGVAAACSIALMGNEPSVRVVRDKIGAEVNRRIRAALGSGAWPEVAHALELGFFGALVQAGCGFSTYREIADELESFVHLVLGGAHP